MLLIGLTTLLIAIPLYSSTITPTLLTRITSITLLFSAALSLNALYVQAIGSGLGLYSGLFHVTSVSQAMEVFLFTVGGFILLGYANETSPIILNNGTLNQTWRTAVPSIAEYPLIVLFTTIGASFLLSSADLVSMYLSIELQSFAVYILAAIYRNSESATSAGLKYFLLGALSSALILLGSSVIYAYTGLTNFEGIYMINNVPDFSLDQLNYSQAFSLNSNAVVLGVLIIGVGFLFKVAAAPFHNWAPDVYDGVPTIVTTWLTVMPKISIFVFLLELGAFAFLHNNAETVLNQYVEGTNALSYFSQVKDYTVWKNLLLTTSLFSLVIGTVVGLAQYRLKRLLAFSTISHVGFLLLALSVNSEESFSSFIFYLIQYSVTNLNAFFVLLAFGYAITYNKQKTNTLSSNNQIDFAFSKSTEKVIRESDITFIFELKGQFHANPVLGLSLAVCLFSMAGIPPLMGFFAKYMVLYSAIENGYYFLALVGILASVVSAAYYLRIIRVIHFDIFEETSKNMNPETNDQGHETAKENVMTSTHSYVIAVLTLSISLFLLSPSLLLNSSNLLALSLFTA